MARSLTTSARVSGALDPSPVRVALVVSRYNRTVTDALERGALKAFADASDGMGQIASNGSGVEIFEAAGAFETIALASAAAATGRFHAIVVLGCIVRGETNHDEILGYSVTRELATISRERSLPVGLGVLTVNTPEQALARAGLATAPSRRGAKAGKPGDERIGNKGAEAMDAALHTLSELRRLRSVVGTDGHARASKRSKLRSPDKLARASRPGARP